MARARTTPRESRRRRVTYVAAEAALVLLAVALAFGAGTVGFIVGRESAEDDAPRAEATAGEATTGEATTGEATTDEATTGEATTAETTTEPAETGEETGTTETDGGGGEAAQGEEVFASAGCASCHTLEAAGATGTIGPNLDETQLNEDEIVQVVTNGRDGMPSFRGQLSEEEIQAVAAFVAGG